MKFKKIFILAGLLLSIAGQGIALAEENDMAELKKQVQILAEEIEKLKLGGVEESRYESFSGLGPAASKVYGGTRGFNIGGYGEIVYSNFQDASKKDVADAYRFVLYGGHKFNDWIVMNTELELEHAGVGNAGSAKPDVTVEFSYLDFLLTRQLNIRTGLILMPIGFINEYHEPTVYNGVLRPEVETKLIPSTWGEIGIMAYGEAENASYKIALTTGLRSDLFSKSGFIRNGRQQGAQANADVAAFIGNINIRPTPSLSFGGTYYTGQAGEGEGAGAIQEQEQKGTISMIETHANLKWRGLELRGLYVKGMVDGNEALKNANSIGKEAEGWYLEAAYDIIPLLSHDSEKSLTPFIRYENYDTNKQVFSGQPDGSLNRTVTSAGLGFKPHPNVAIKADYQWKNTASDLPAGKGTGLDENKIDQFNLGIGFIF